MLKISLISSADGHSQLLLPLKSPAPLWAPACPCVKGKDLIFCLIFYDLMLESYVRKLIKSLLRELQQNSWVPSYKQQTSGVLCLGGIRGRRREGFSLGDGVGGGRKMII